MMSKVWLISIMMVGVIFTACNPFPDLDDLSTNECIDVLKSIEDDYNLEFGEVIIDSTSTWGWAEEYGFFIDFHYEAKHLKTNLFNANCDNTQLETCSTFSTDSIVGIKILHGDSMSYETIELYKLEAKGIYTYFQE